MQLVLASTSKYRKQLLEKLNISFSCVDPLLDESPFMNNYDSPEILVEVLAKEKALAARKIQRSGLILGGDQVAELDGKILGKPETRENAFRQLSEMQGKTHRLLTAFCLLKENGDIFTDIDITELTMKKLTDKQINWYLDADEPYDCAGSYKLECFGISLFEKIMSEDQTAIMGLPLLKLSNQLNRLGMQNP